MKIRLLRDDVLIEPDADVTSGTDSGDAAGLIVAPDDAAWHASEATVIAVGPGRRDKRGRRQPTELEPGDRVRFDVCTGAIWHLHAEGKPSRELRILPESEILGAIE